MSPYSVTTLPSSGSNTQVVSIDAVKITDGHVMLSRIDACGIPSTTEVTSYTETKRGIAYNNASLIKTILPTTNGKLSWGYNWDATDGNLDTGITYIPTCWSDKSEDWFEHADVAISRGSDAIFSFNEPDIASQANMSPVVAADAHIRLLIPFQNRTRIAAPSISNSQDPNQGIGWLKQFWTACAGRCAVDFCNAHWYGPGGVEGANQFLTYLTDVRTACGGRPVWVTEFKAMDSINQEEEFMKYALRELDTNPAYRFVERYAYFYFHEGFLTGGDRLNSFGQLYVSI
ncbi:glycoside hydrolase family 128 protein [Hypoxylon trugodes]|uniref:glycoside hydrolase family 128 protein n=1 Tax=Hypoxylon trugodes TaxID=326681 RepID=UPI00218EFF5B|nr:glycoside hydrolase family 128 protein [Hypoxylon trugodes]KAI1382558.1 glycoside hydrolase family 128 protein [Hypoxylon trugodes]